MRLVEALEAFVAICKGLLNDYRFAIESVVLSCFSLVLTKAEDVSRVGDRSQSTWYANDMAGDEVFCLEEFEVR